MRRLALLTTVLALLSASSAFAVEIYVDNVNGSDGFDGLTPDIESDYTGPVLTLQRGLKLLRNRDTLVLRNNGRPYFESLALVGARHSGSESHPLVIQGNGATLSGVRQLSNDGWQPLDNGLWRLSLTRKGHYRFFRDGNPWPEHRTESSVVNWDELPEGHWLAQRGAVYFRFPVKEPPVDRVWTYAAEEFGISLVDVRHVQIVDLNVQGFRVDGINADNACRAVTLERVVSQHNGRAGLAAGGTSRVRLAGSRIAGNGRHSVLVTEFAGVDIEASDLGGVEPTLVEAAPSKGGVSVSAAASTSANFSPVALK
jgi:hypothetical protein